MPRALTLDAVRDALPAYLKAAATQAHLDWLNSVTADPVTAGQVRDNVIAHAGVLNEGRFRIGAYVNAVVYVTFKLMGRTNGESFRRAFPERCAALEARDATDKEISAYVAHYNKTRLVSLILAQAAVPPWLSNPNALQRMLNTLVDRMENAPSERVRCDAARQVLEMLKRPEILRGKPGTIWA